MPFGPDDEAAQQIDSSDLQAAGLESCPIEVFVIACNSSLSEKMLHRISRTTVMNDELTHSCVVKAELALYDVPSIIVHVEDDLQSPYRYLSFRSLRLCHMIVC